MIGELILFVYFIFEFKKKLFKIKSLKIRKKKQQQRLEIGHNSNIVQSWLQAITVEK